METEEMTQPLFRTFEVRFDEPEIAAMDICAVILGELPPPASRRAVEWLNAKFGTAALANLSPHVDDERRG